jgi:hypothetical protein
MDFVCVCSHIYIQTDILIYDTYIYRQTHIYTERQRDRERETERQTHTHTHTHTPRARTKSYVQTDTYICRERERERERERDKHTHTKSEDKVATNCRGGSSLPSQEIGIQFFSFLKLAKKKKWLLLTLYCLGFVN